MILCKFGIHDWTNWVDMDNIITSGHHHQYRYCKHCNISKRRWTE